jgi:tetratricopeptide (TPR) repeat protein
MTRAKSRAWTIKAFALFLSGVSVVACASANKAAIRQASTESASSFAAGDFAKALGPYRDLYVKDRANGRVVKAYAAAIEGVKNAGDYARDKGSYATALCAFRILIERWDGFSAIAPKLTFKRAELETGVRDCRLALCERQFRQELGAGSYAKALATYQAALKEYPGDRAVKAGYAKAFGKIGAIGAKALAEADYALAGKIDGLLLKDLESFEGLAGADAAGGLSRQELEEALRLCSSGLTNGGLAEYRKGNLESAIGLWEELLAFDPENAEIKKAVETAKAQLGKLKSSARGGRRSGQSGHGARGRS